MDRRIENPGRDRITARDVAKYMTLEYHFFILIMSELVVIEPNYFDWRTGCVPVCEVKLLQCLGSNRMV